MYPFGNLMRDASSLMCTILVVLISAGVFGCTINAKSEKEGESITRVLQHTFTPKTPCDTIELSFVVNPVHLEAYDKKLWVGDFNRPIIEIVDLGSFPFESTRIELKQGRGPGEVGKMYSHYLTSNKLYVTDLALFKILVYSYPDIDFIKEYSLKQRPIEIFVKNEVIYVATIGSEYRMVSIDQDSLTLYKDEIADKLLDHSMNPFQNFGTMLSFKEGAGPDFSDEIEFYKSYLYANRVAKVKLKNGFINESLLRKVGQSKESETRLAVKGKTKQFTNTSSTIAVFHEIESGYCAMVADEKSNEAFLDFFDEDFTYTFSYTFKNFTSLPSNAIVVNGYIVLILDEQLIIYSKP